MAREVIFEDHKVAVPVKFEGLIGLVLFKLEVQWRSDDKKQIGMLTSYLDENGAIILSILPPVLSRLLKDFVGKWFFSIDRMEPVIHNPWIEIEEDESSYTLELLAGKGLHAVESGGISRRDE